MSRRPDQLGRTRVNPRTTRVRQVIVDAAMDLLIREGAGAVTAVRIAEATGVARTTIYSHWATPVELLIQAIDSVVSPHVPTNISDSVEEDLALALSTLHKRMVRKHFRAIFATLLAHADRDAKAVAAQRRFVNGVLEPIHDILSAAKERGDLPSSLDIESASARLAGPLFHRHVMLRAPINNQLIAETIDQFLYPYGYGRLSHAGLE